MEHQNLTDAEKEKIIRQFREEYRAEEQAKKEKFDKESVIFEDENSKISLRYEGKCNVEYKPADEDGNYDENSESINFYDTHIKSTWYAELIEKHGKHVFTFEDKQNDTVISFGIDEVEASKRLCFLEVPTRFDIDGFEHPIEDYDGDCYDGPSVDYSDKLNEKENKKRYTVEVNGEETDISNNKNLVNNLKGLIKTYVDPYYVDTIEKTNPHNTYFYESSRITGQSLVDFMIEKRNEEIAIQLENARFARLRESAEAQKAALRKQQHKKEKDVNNRVTNYVTDYLAKRNTSGK